MAKQKTASRSLRDQIVTAQASAAVDNDKATSSDHASYPIPPCTPPRNSRPGSIETGITTIEDTPMTQSSHGPDRGYGTVEEQASYLREELERHKLEAGDDFGGTTFLNTATREQLKGFFANTNHYTKKRWNGIPKVPPLEKTLYRPYVAIVSGILSYFNISARQMVPPEATLEVEETLNIPPDALISGSDLAEGTAPQTVHDTFATKLGGNEGVDNTASDTSDVLISESSVVQNTTPRLVHDTHATKLSHTEGVDDTSLKTSPDILISGFGDGFWPDSKLVRPSKRSSKASIKPTYRGCASPLEIKTEKNYTFWDNLIQIAVYARQCFIQQENRFFVYSAILTETFIQLFQFDRAGVMYSQRINIHHHPRYFVRVILALASPDPAALGLDTSIQWCGSKRYLTMPTRAENELVRYEIENLKACFLRRAIRGRGTCCWNLIDPNTGDKYLAKDCWRSVDRTPEWELLEMAKGLEGVGQMIDYWEPKMSISSLRGINCNTPNFRDRTFSRVLLERYGKPIHQFDNKKQLLSAFRDAIAGHRNLWNKGILHRDISINNILMGKENAPVGNRGVVIDLDMAVLLNREGSLAGVDFRTGTRIFQSIMVLRSQMKQQPGTIFPAHDYLDDLESCFYVLCWICFAYDGPGLLIRPQPSFLCMWEELDPERASDSKRSFFHKYALPEVSSWFGKTFDTLLENFRKFLDAEISRKDRLMHEKAPRLSLEELKTDATKHYAIVLGFVDDAIREVEALPDTSLLFASGLPPATTPPATPPQASASPGKRRSDDVPEGSPSIKKPRTNPHAPRYPSTLSTETSSMDDFYGD